VDDRQFAGHKAILLDPILLRRSRQGRRNRLDHKTPGDDPSSVAPTT
jgi:hypothetical protein